MKQGVVLVTQRTIRASPQRLFDAWTRPEQLLAWWGPRPVTCTRAEIDLRVGGRYRITNALPDGKAVVIEGEFELIEAPRRLVYSWRIGDEEDSRVTVRFEPRGDATEVIIVHEQIPGDTIRDSHGTGWTGCLDGLERHFTPA
ncbi:MAG TPA: SRPBCC domain-containing protein [Polyangiaceae bacterium]